MATYTRRAFIGGVDFTDSLSTIRFSWNQNGCDKATLMIASAAFDETFGIEQEQDVKINYQGTSGTNRWWRGIVEELETAIDGGLTIQCSGTKVFLSEIIPSGRFGTLVETTLPDDVDVNEGAAATGAPGVPQTRHIIAVTAVDAEGETVEGTRIAGHSGGTLSGVGVWVFTPSAENKRLTISWVASTNGATGYNVYINPSTTPNDPDDLLSVNGMVVFSVVGTSFVIDGSRTGEGKDFPFTIANGISATAITPTIANTKIENVVNYLLNTFLPDELTKGTIEIGTLNIDLDYYDLQDNSADLQRVLDALVAISGDVQWYVDEDNTIHFREKSTTIASSRKFVIKDVGVVLSTANNSLVGASRRQTRDGITTVKIVSTEVLEQGKDASNTELGVVWDSTTEPTSIDSSYIRSTTDPRMISTARKKGGTVIPSLPTLSWMETNYGDLQAWLNDFPSLRTVWISRTLWDEEGSLNSILRAIRSYMGYGGGTQILSRPRVIVKEFAGVRTAPLAAKTVINWITRKSPNPIRWTLVVENLDSTMLVVPGQGNIQLTTQQGTRYQIPVQSISYEFDEAVRMTLICGDELYEANEELDDMRDAILTSSFRRNSPTKWGEFSE